ncbi:SseB protein N-terminal domain-containing protein [Limimaricola pyoseonensis]|uniref:SseB protein N-terminal domain-containing protein n=2 Tax=Limimaricola pyoseonensis TaxID=521013 RepID=A0A1G7G3R1_9RHOB|nr:SseB protein N-terminal domain-containing protein [Limimaricola pyoseonensis]
METGLDLADAAMARDPEDDAARLRYYGRLADAELYMLLSEEAGEDDVTPVLIEEAGQSYAVAFDSEERLSDYAGGLAYHAAVPGRALAQILAGQGIGLALNPRVAPSARLLPPEALEWLAETLTHAPQEAAERPVAVNPPRDFPEALLAALDEKLTSARGLAREAFLVRVEYANGREAPLLAFLDPAPNAEKGLAVAVGEALTFSGLEEEALDVTFLSGDAEIARRIAKVGLRLKLPQPHVAPGPKAPGSDPEKPPRLH